MNKKDYQLFAEVVSRIEDEDKRKDVMSFLFPIFRKDNQRFDGDRFREFVQRRVDNISLVGMRCNPKYLYTDDAI
jgi:hypothetical protein